MADTAETEGSEESVLGSTDGSNKGHPTRGLLQLKASSSAAFPDCQNSEKTNSGTHSLKQSRKKAKTGSVRGGPSSGNRLVRGTPGITSAGSTKVEGRFRLPKPKIDVRAFFDYYFVRKQHRRLKKGGLWRKEEKDSRRRTRRKPPERQRPTIPVTERKKRYRERGLQFPFVEKLCGRKYIPFKLVCRYEQAALLGYLRYIKTLKYEHHLKKSLTKLNAGDDLENESLESRKYKYLDDDGPLSPIEETIDEDQNKSSDNDDIGARIVEKSSFILSSRIPERKKSKKKSS